MKDCDMAIHNELGEDMEVQHRMKQMKMETTYPLRTKNLGRL